MLHPTRSLTIANGGVSLPNFLLMRLAIAVLRFAQTSDLLYLDLALSSQTGQRGTTMAGWEGGPRH